MKKRITSVLLAVCLIMALAAQFAPRAWAEEIPDVPEQEITAAEAPADDSPVTVTNYDELILAMQEAEDGDVIGIAGKIVLPPNTNLGHGNKHLTLQRMDVGSYTGFEVEETGESSSIIISNLTFDGAGIVMDSYFISCNETFFYDSVFTNCYTDFGGGAVQIRDGDVFFRNCLFDNNKASLGSHISMNGGNLLQIKDCTLKNGYSSIMGVL